MPIATRYDGMTERRLESANLTSHTETCYCGPSQCCTHPAVPTHLAHLIIPTYSVKRGASKKSEFAAYPFRKAHAVT
jgi:hypothetical protein